MNKQIEEMARTMCGAKEHSCAECDSCDLCEFWIEAQILYANGYRKTEDVAREIFELVECAFSPVLVYEGHTIKQYLAELKKKYESEGVE